MRHKKRLEQLEAKGGHGPKIRFLAIEADGSENERIAEFKASEALSDRDAMFVTIYERPPSEDPEAA
ncbi:MAG: hypothetical protein AAFS03_07690 [Pseudomonadota bacterium]